MPKHYVVRLSPFLPRPPFPHIMGEHPSAETHEPWSAARTPLLPCVRPDRLAHGPITNHEVRQGHSGCRVGCTRRQWRGNMEK
eukprot:7931629-Alexandrium_andersonii.AAC.1